MSKTINPFYIIGCPRSGTTLFQLLVASHPNIAIPPESHIFVRFSSIFDKYGDLNIDENLRLLVDDLLKDYHIRDWNLNISTESFCEKLQEKTIRGTITQIMELFANKEGKQRWGDKTPQHGLFLNEIIKIFPEAKFIHLIRDGRDVAVSSSRIFVGPPSIYGIAKEWRRYINCFDDFKAKLDPSRCLEIKYENIVRHTDKEMRKVFEFLGEAPIDFNKKVPDSWAKKYYLNADAHMQSLSKPISDKKIGKFKQYFDQRKIAIFESVAGRELKRYNYDVSTPGGTILSTKEKITFLLMDKIYRYYRKYMRPKEFNKVSYLFKRELQFHARKFVRSMRR